MRQSTFTQIACHFISVFILSNTAQSQCPIVAPVPNNACYQQVINDDPWCCFNDWDIFCQTAYDACTPGGGPAIAGDCPDAIPICTINNFSIDPNGYGTTDELCIGCTSNPSINPASANDGCLLSGELNSTWFSISVVTGGNMQFSFGTPGGGNCYDWAMWSYNASTCTNIANNTQAPIRCNWNGTCDSYTGIGPTPPGGYSDNFEPSLAVTAGQQFILCFSNWSSAITNVPIAFTGSANIDCIPLSIEMNTLVANDYEGYNTLTWNTQAEINCSHYEIQRSTDGVSFEQIGQVAATGTTFEPTSYQFEDFQPIQGVSYYRVNQVKLDGSAVPSIIVAANQEMESAFTVVRSYPNPADGDFTIQFSQLSPSEVSIRVLALNGEVVSSHKAFFQSGSQEAHVSTEMLSSGMYITEIRQLASQHSESIKLSIR